MNKNPLDAPVTQGQEFPLTTLGQLIAELQHVAADIGPDAPVLFEEEQIGEDGLAAICPTVIYNNTYGAAAVFLSTHWILDQAQATRAISAQASPELPHASTS